MSLNKNVNRINTCVVIMKTFLMLFYKIPALNYLWHNVSRIYFLKRLT